MDRNKFKWKCFFILYLILINTFTKCLPVYDNKIPSIILKDTSFEYSERPLVKVSSITAQTDSVIESENGTNIRKAENSVQSRQFSQVRPGQKVNSYNIQLTDNGNDFSGRAVYQVTSTTETMSNQLRFQIKDLSSFSVRVGFHSEANTEVASSSIDGNVLRINPPISFPSYVVVIEWTGQYTNLGYGLYKGDAYGNGTYLAMNLHPIHARRVFPCMDEPTQSARIRFTFNDMEYTHLLSNAMLEDGSSNQFRALEGAPHVFGMLAHNFVNINVPVTNVMLYARPGILTQDHQASAAISFYYTHLNEWTNNNHAELLADQDGRLNIVALPDISMDWHALSTIGIWEGDILMQTIHSIKQRKTALFQIAQAMAKQWYGNIVTPENWRFEWVVSGLASYAGYEVMRLFQEDNTGTDVSLLDVNTLFVTDVIQESLLQDAYPDSQPMEPDSNIFDEEPIRNHINGLLKIKAPAILRMMRIVLGDPEDDFIQSGARSLIHIASLDPINTLSFVSTINGDWIANGNDKIDNVADFLAPWRTQAGYPVLHVSRSPGTVLVRQDPFSFGNDRDGIFPVPITFTTSVNPDFTNFQPELVADNTRSFRISLGDDDWILFNIQGQGYYRVDYNPDLWDNIIGALEDPERREEIHPLNRATLVDDSMNLARSGRIDYDIALRIILTMEHETEYAVWKAFVRNMEFLRKRLVALITNDEDLDPDIYVRMVRRTIHAIEEQLGYDPEPNLAEPAMHTLTRGLVMEHACKAKHDECVAAAVDWFYDPNDGDVVNPNIPHELRPAVYCTMVRDGEDEVIEALMERFDIEPTIYERVVILEALACSTNEEYIGVLLQETISDDSPYSVEERNKILAAVIESNYRNAFVALNFMSTHTSEIVNRYGGLERYEKLLYLLADNMADEEQQSQFRIWANSQNNNLDDMGMTAGRAWLRVEQNMEWVNTQLEDVYNWINENDASSMVLSFSAICVSLMVALINY